MEATRMLNEYFPHGNTPQTNIYPFSPQHHPLLKFFSSFSVAIVSACIIKYVERTFYFSISYLYHPVFLFGLLSLGLFQCNNSASIIIEERNNL